MSDFTTQEAVEAAVKLARAELGGGPEDPRWRGRKRMLEAVQDTLPRLAAGVPTHVLE